MKCLYVAVLAIAVAFFATGVSAQMPWEGKAPSPVLDGIASGQPQDVIVLFDDADIENQARVMRENIGAAHDTRQIIAVKKAAYDARKQKVLGGFLYGEEETLIDYSHLPMMFMRIRTQSALAQLLSQPEVARVYADENYRHFLSSSLPFINQPQVAALNMKGAGTAVAVIDTGVDYTRSAFGSCSSTNTPGDCLSLPAAHASCRVACVHDFAPNDGALDVPPYHGTNVSGIVVGVAPETKVIGLDVFSGSSASGSNIVAAINWCIANQAVYNIVAMNMSLGAGLFTSPCGTDFFASAINLAKNAGILSAIASGNDGATSALASPACVPGAVSVGAVYDANYGAVSGSCTDVTTAPDKVTCFSNSADFLTILAPGIFVTAAGITMSGTSQATPHIAGSIAVLRGQNAFPSDTLDQIVARMTSTGHPDIDTRSGAGGRVKPRIDLLAAAGGGGGGGGGTLSISGVVSYGRTFLSGVTITLSGAASGTTTTGSNGTYSFTGLGSGSYTIVPSKTGYTFTPVSRSVNLSGTNAAGQNFSAALGGGGQTLSISGNVTSGGLPLSGVSVALTGGANKTATTDGSGNYVFSGLAGGTYTVTPSMTGYTFTPSSQSVTISGANAGGVNFIGASTGGGGGTFSISGTVTTRTSRLLGVTMTLTGGGTGSVKTDALGNYIFTGLAAGTYTITPSMITKTFTPASRTVTISGTNITGQNFLGTP